MSKRNEMDFCKDIMEASKRALTYSKNLDYKAFSKDIKTQDAIIRNIEIIGEAVKNIPEDSRNLYPNIPWKNMAGMRDKLIHHYFGINIDIVWDVVKTDLPEIIKKIEEIFEQQ